MAILPHNQQEMELYVYLRHVVQHHLFQQCVHQESREISITFSETDGVITMTMQNNGPALDEKYRDNPMQIFEIGESTKPDGTGLGLWLMRDAVERNDGRIYVLNINDGFGIQIEWKQ